MPEWSGEGTVIPGSRCPKCNSPLEYNGNYWCSERDCTYTMPDYEHMKRRDKQAFNVAYILYMRQRGQEPKASAILQEVLDD